jgi:4-carboxymuconolactone decarboxylase
MRDQRSPTALARRTGGLNLQRTRAPETGRGGYDADARHAQALGHGPRIDAIPNDQIDANAWSLVNTLRESAGAPPVDVMPEFMRVMAKHPPVFRRQMEMGNVLFNGRISPRERELAVLRISWLAGAPFEWGEHVVISKRCGVTAEEIERVTLGSSAADWSEHDAAILRGVEELVADFAVSDETWRMLAKSWDEPQLIEFPMMVGQYLTTAFLLNSLKVPLGAGNAGLAQR